MGGDRLVDSFNLMVHLTHLRVSDACLHAGDTLLMYVSSDADLKFCRRSHTLLSGLFASTPVASLPFNLMYVELDVLSSDCNLSLIIYDALALDFDMQMLCPVVNLHVY